ncbi:SAF domain-containing protein [Ornithinimicrobium tianjinense]|uniref:SAF domain-containing protein n=1 Tax=Ornithinimicrobium tianjinense TaxID=1195761 RepID=A0A917BRI1_9MICO|nr:SAF domain-containing protein [Ornithinimicrobium tianjinense]GGF54047.1 hypothetical protein GCM10011366_22330 [Ornithinimicrobium tianjinense]
MSSSATRSAAPTRLPSRARDKRPALAVLALLLVLLGALGSALIVFRSSERTEVLMAARPLEQGQVLTAEDFRVVEMAWDDADTQLIGATALDNFVGASALTHIPANTVLAPQMFTASAMAPEGATQVGVVVPSAGRPSEGFRVNDIVRVFQVPDQAAIGGGGATEELVEAAKVVHVGEASTTTDMVHVTLLVPDADAAAVIAASSTGTAALSVLPADTAPVVDWRTQ